MSKQETPDNTKEKHEVQVHDLIKGNNIIFYLMYYDEFIEKPEYELTYLEGADAGYYNCAQAVSKFNDKIAEDIEYFYKSRGISPAVYIDPKSPTNLTEALEAMGYKANQEEEENWYSYDLTSGEEIDPRQYLKDASLNVTSNEVKPDDSNSFQSFIKINQEANSIPEEIKNKLVENVKNRGYPGASNHLILGYVDGKPAVTTSVGIYNGVAYLAEGAVHKDYARMGLYSYILAEALKFAEDKGCTQALFTCSTNAFSNNAGQKVGFKLLFRRDYYQLTN